MDIKKIKELIKLLEKSELAVLDVSDDDGAIHLEKPYNDCCTNVVAQPVAAPASVPVAPASPVAPVQETAPAQSGKSIKSPMVGVFYAAPAPDKPAFVSVGSTVNKGDVVCIIEAMKIMNEITAEESGTITEILVNNGDVVEYDQPLFKIG
ncbi:MAG: acetyl-CoA carboxylase biotin carboxyl carrier protein [Ruminococcus sp.]|nr:acetyl-CoA carboxylase biotin carboxyl carrier protein [Ruminococcus sp.]